MGKDFFSPETSITIKQISHAITGYSEISSHWSKTSKLEWANVTFVTSKVTGKINDNAACLPYFK